MLFPTIDDATTGSGRPIADTYSLRFDNVEQVSPNQCFSPAAQIDLSVAETESCTELRTRIWVNQSRKLSAPIVVEPGGSNIDVHFHARFRNTPIDVRWNLAVELKNSTTGESWVFHELDAANPEAVSGPVTGTSAWQKIGPLPPTAGTGAPDSKLVADQGSFEFDEYSLSILTNQFYGTVWLDDVSLTVSSTDPGSGNVTTSNILLNPTFDQGHRQLAVPYLNRLNGVGFWGSIGHFLTGGFSFTDTARGRAPNSFVYFLRGLPLGDAVWYDETNLNGILYGDPLYSPVDVSIDYVWPDEREKVQGYDRLFENAPLTIDARNGESASGTSTTWSLDYCETQLPYECANWQPTGIGGLAGGTDIDVGPWDWTALGLTPRFVTLRLSVVSQSAATAQTQSFYDYYTVYLDYYPDASTDTDNDGIADVVELSGNTWRERADSDLDGITDFYESRLGTDPNHYDTDGDSIADIEDPDTGLDIFADSDGDGVMDLFELFKGTDYLDPGSLPQFETHFVSPLGGDAGSQHPHPVYWSNA